MNWNSATVTRAVKATIRGYQEATGRVATGAKVTFQAGEPIVEVTSSTESPTPAPVETGGENVETLKQRMRGCHERRS